MTHKNLVNEIVDALEMINSECFAYMHRKTFEIFIETGEFSYMDDDELAEGDFADLADWEQEELQKRREIQSSDDWLSLPSSRDVHEWSIMRDFAVEQGELQDELLDAIHGKGAFRVFKSKLQQHDLIDQWYKFKQAALTRIALDWLESHNLRPDE